jgi:hypothetical protein
VARLPANTDTGFGIDTRKGRLHAGLFVFGAKAGFAPAVLFRERRGERAPVFSGRRKKISRCMQLFVTIRYYGSGRLVGQRTCVLLR